MTDTRNLFQRTIQGKVRAFARQVGGIWGKRSPKKVEEGVRKLSLQEKKIGRESSFLSRSRNKCVVDALIRFPQKVGSKKIKDLCGKKSIIKKLRGKWGKIA